MAVLPNELLVPKSIDPHTAVLHGAFAFCATYLLRIFCMDLQTPFILHQ
jgi:hypothetical protein